LMGVESNFGAADARAVVTWPDAEVAARLNPLPDCSFVFQSFDFHTSTIEALVWNRATKRQTDGRTDRQDL